MRSFTATLIVFSSPSAFAGWVGAMTPEDSLLPGRGGIEYASGKTEGAEAFEAASFALTQAGNAQKIQLANPKTKVISMRPWPNDSVEMVPPAVVPKHVGWRRACVAGF